jgi:FKBP-type peptidyl-prolyl cis-trans isomerase
VRRFAALLLVPALMLGAAACGDGKSGKSSASPSPSAPPTLVPASTTGAVEANPAFGAAADLKIPDGKAPDGLQVKVLTEGTGAPLTKYDVVQANYEGVAWSNKHVFDSSLRRGKPEEFPLSGVIKGWTQGLEGKKIGSRVLLTIPPDLGYGGSGQGADIGANETLVFVVDVVAATPGYANGTPVTVNNPDLPTVTTDGPRPVKINFPAGKAAPTQLVNQNLIEGNGAAVAATDTVQVQVVQWLWGAPTALGASWDQGPQSVSLAQNTSAIMKTLGEALTGKKVGSRVLLVIPPD